MGRLGGAMQRVDGFYMYSIGQQLFPLKGIKSQTSSSPGTMMEDVMFQVFIAQSAIETLLTRSVFRLRTS
jgi:hypothetical protein